LRHVMGDTGDRDPRPPRGCPRRGRSRTQNRKSRAVQSPVTGSAIQ
jgi:hypothetical protein